MKGVRLAGAILLMAFALYVVVMNWACVIISRRNARRGIDKHHSTIPALSAIPAVLALALYPYAPRLWIAAIPLLDIANWLVLIGIPLAIVRGRRGS